ncbi:hypothetical protein KY41_03090 [Latilactobacillus sakei]|nr:hypothetical protein KY41_03090 [Latilactobacillus sakei]
MTPFERVKELAKKEIKTLKKLLLNLDSVKIIFIHGIKRLLEQINFKLQLITSTFQLITF